MKKTKIITCCLLIQATISCAQLAQVTVHVTDELGNAVTNAHISAGFNMAMKPGEGWGSGKPNSVKADSDAEGNCVISEQCTAGSVGVSIGKEGYYSSSDTLIFTNLDSVLRRWQPWNPTLEIILKTKGVQVPMYVREMREIKIPVEGKPIGFDLMVADWVVPYGKGQASDFIFQVEIKPAKWITNWYGTSPRPYPLQDNTMRISFSNDGDGVQSIFMPPRVQSQLRLPRQAPSDLYESVLVKTQHDEIVSVEHQNTKLQHHTNLNKNQNYFFRVRTKKDAQGKIVSSLYGKISGEFNNASGIGDRLSFTYYLNPESNSRNMEFDGHNLAK